MSNPVVDVCMTGPSLAALDRGPMSPDEIAWMRRVGNAVRGPR